MTTATLTPDRMQYRALVAQVAAKAREKLPQAVNGRIEKAVKLVLAGDVEPQDDGSITVYSATDATRRYVLQGTSCTCTDYERGQAPDGWCAHRIAAGIDKRVRELLPAPQEKLCESHSSALPEAPASVNCHILLEGRQVQVTLRDTDEQRLLERLAAVLRQYPDLPSAHAKKGIKSSGETSDTGQPDWCQIHACAMKRHENAQGVWFSHYIDGRHCKGR
jgi:hypothetical protein